MNAPNLQLMRVWDLPTRIFHWASFALITSLFVTAYAGGGAAHAAMGQAVLVLMVFRMAWGVVGSQTARFTDFVVGPAAIRSYLAAGKSGTAGHNPLGAMMVLGLLGTNTVQAMSGLFSSDGIGFDGPFAHVIGNAASDSVTRLHAALAYVIAGLVAIHVAAILLHRVRHGENLVLPMFSGKKWVQASTPQPRFSHTARAFAILAAAGALLGLARTIL